MHTAVVITVPVTCSWWKEWLFMLGLSVKRSCSFREKIYFSTVEHQKYPRHDIRIAMSMINFTDICTVKGIWLFGQFTAISCPVTILWSAEINHASQIPGQEQVNKVLQLFPAFLRLVADFRSVAIAWTQQPSNDLQMPSMRHAHSILEIELQPCIFSTRINKTREAVGEARHFSLPCFICKVVMWSTIRNVVVINEVSGPEIHNKDLNQSNHCNFAKVNLGIPFELS